MKKIKCKRCSYKYKNIKVIKIEFLTAWERKNNPFFDGTNLGTILESVKNQIFN